MTTLNSYSINPERLLPQEELYRVAKHRKQLIIGVPKETQQYENRVPLTPQSVQVLVSNGHIVFIETNAGKVANYTDLDYSEAGATIVNNKEEIFRCEIVLKIASLTNKETEYLSERITVISSLIVTTQSEQSLRKLMQKKITAIAFEFLKDSSGAFPVVRSMSEISGTESIMIAAEYLSNAHNGKGVLLGGIAGITPTEVLIFGAGTAGEFAARTALGLGALVKVFDSSVYKLSRLHYRLNQRIYTSVFHPQILHKELKSADVVIGAIRLIDKVNRYYISVDLVKKMKKGSVIIDMSIDQGGCFETSKPTNHGNPVFEKYGVIHYCVPNIASRIARTASIALSNIFTPLLLNIGMTGGIKAEIKDDIGLRNGVYIYNGILTNKHLGNMFNIQSKDINLLMAAF